MKKDNTAVIQKGNRLIEEFKKIIEELENSNEGLSSERTSVQNNVAEGSSEAHKAIVQLQNVMIKAEAANELKKKTVRTTVDFSSSTHRLIQEHLKTHNHYRKIAPWLIYLAERELGLKS